MTTAKQVFDAFADSVIRIMEDPEREWNDPERHGNDFCNLAVAGESLRRLVNGMLDEDERQPYAVETLAKYDEFLRNYKGIIPTRVVDDVPSVLEDIVVHACRNDRNYDDGTNLLDELEHTLMIAVACSRVPGGLDKSVVAALGQEAEEMMGDIAPEVPELAEYAWHRDVPFGRDSDVDELYDFWEAMARHSKSERTVGDLVREMARRELEREKKEN